jgi:DNA-binding transcriptional LysR family regulator
MKVAELEKQLGVRLLERTTRIVRPTSAGRRYLESVQPALEALRDAGRTVADLEAEPTGLLRITAAPELGQFLFGRVLSTYMERHPAVTIETDLTPRHVDLIEEGFDIALRAGRLPDSSLVARPVGAPQRPALCASPAYLERRGMPRVPADLGRHDCLVTSERQEPTRWEFRDGGERVTIEVQPRAVVNSFTVLRDLAAAGMGLTWLPAFLARPALAEGTLLEVLRPFYPPARGYHAVYPASRRLSARVQTFLAVLAEEAADLLGPP